MAYEGDEMANRLWNEFFGSGYGHPHQPSFHGYPGDTESGPMHNSYPYPYPYPYPVPSHRRHPSNRSLAEIESRPPPPREQLPQPSRLEMSTSEIESGPPSPVAPPPRQQRRPSRAQQTEIESLPPLPLLQLPPPPTRPPPPPPPSRPRPPPPPTRPHPPSPPSRPPPPPPLTRPSPPPPPTRPPPPPPPTRPPPPPPPTRPSPPSPPTRPPPPPPPTRPSPPSPPTRPPPPPPPSRPPPPPPPREQHPPLPRREVEIKSGPSSPVAPPSPRQQSRPSRAQQSEIESLPPSPQPSRLATPPPRAAAKPANKVSGGSQRANQKKSKSICSRPLIISAVLFFLAGIIFFAAFHPKTPSFRLDAVTVYNFNATGAALSYRLDAEFTSHNPNRHIGIYYQRLEAFAVYGPQRITDPRVPLSPANLYQGHKAHIAWPPVVISGDGVQLPAAEQAILAGNRAGGGVRLEILLKGRFKWKVGSLTSTRWHLYVTCPANLLFENPSTGVQVGGGLRFALGESCYVETKLNN